MPSTIPYDPSLNLANVIPLKKLLILEEISKAQAPIDAAEEALHRAERILRSFDMTLFEMGNMQIDTSDLMKERKKAADAVKAAAKKYIDKQIESLSTIATLESALAAGVEGYIESPVDYNKTQIKTMPLSADSMKMNAQYFSFDKEGESSQSVTSSIRSFVSEQTQFLGNKRSVEASAAAHGAAHHQKETHDIVGTLVITASCTHKDALLLAPCILDVDKGIRAWNATFPSDKLDTDNPASLTTVGASTNALHLLSGESRGSSFVGMVHILRLSSSESSQSMMSMATHLTEQMQAGCWFASESGGFGVDASFAASVKNLLSTATVSAHITVITSGVIPSLKSNDLQTSVEKFADFDAKSMMANLGAMAAASESDKNTAAHEAAKAKAGAQVQAVESAKVGAVMLGLAKADDEHNKVLDNNSMMTAFEDYVQKAIAGDCGVPLTYYIKPITKKQLAEMWVAKYYPGSFTTSAGDDSKPVEPEGGGGGGGGGGDGG